MVEASNRSVAEIIRGVATEHADIADPKELAPFVLEELRGNETLLLERLLPSYISALLRHRSPGDGSEWNSFLEERIPTPHGVVFGRDASVDDLRRGAERRRVFAGRLDRRAMQYDGVADAMLTEDVQVAQQLSNNGQSSIRLRMELIALKTDRQRGERATAILASLRKSKEQMEDLARQGRNPLVEMLELQREQLAKAKADLIDQLDRGQHTNDVIAAMAVPG